MKAQKNIKNSKTTIISIIILDLILMSLFLFFSDLILKDFKNSSSLYTVVISGFAIAIPGTLIILIIIQSYFLFKNKFSPGNNFKKNIVLYFIITIFIVVIPQAFISTNFIKASTNNWLNSRVKKAVDIGFDMALDIEINAKKDIVDLSVNKLFNTNLINMYFNKDILINDILTLSPTVSTIEIYNNTNKESERFGMLNFYLPNIDFNIENSFYPKFRLSNHEVLFYQYKLFVNNQELVIILSHSLPLEFSSNGAILTSVKQSLQITTTKTKDITFGMFIYYSLFSIPMLLLSILGVFIFSDEVVKPLKDIEEAIKTVAQGNYSYRILSKKNNEFNILIDSFNNMIKEVEKSRNKLKHTEQISTWQDIATRLAHEIRNPLTPIKLSAQRVLLKENNSTNNKVISKHMETIINEVTRMEKLLNEFRDFARFPKLQLSNTSFSNVINESINILISTYPEVQFDLTSVKNMFVQVDKNQMIQVISNLTINSIHAIEHNGTIHYSTETVQKKGVEYCRVSIKDNGKGIPKEVLPNIFKPYYTTKYNGSGLGLAIVNKIVLDHKGKIWIETAENIGTTFYFEFPKEAI